MAANKRNKVTLERDRVEIAQLSLDGWTLGEIGEKLGLSAQQIWYDLQVIMKRWQKETNLLLDQRKARELMKLERLERKYLEGFQRSKQDSERLSEEKRSTADGAFTKTSITTETTAGDPRFLDGAKDCARLRAQIAGAMVTKVAPVTPDGKSSWNPDKVEQLTDDDLLAINGIYERIIKTPANGNGQNGHAEAGLN